MSKQKGFTLLEIIIALTLFMLMSVGVFATLRIALKTWSRCTTRMEHQLRFRTISESIEKQVACFAPIMVPLDSGLIRGQRIPYLRGDRDRMQFVSLSALKFQESPGLTIVSYFIKDALGKRFLVENERRYLGYDSLNVPIVNSEGDIHLFEIENAEFRYFDKSDDGATSMWVDSFDSTLRWQLPQAVEIKVFFRKDARNVASMRRFVVPITAKPLYQPNLRQMQQRPPGTVGGRPNPGPTPGPTR